jgi:hypothetical protein
MFIRSFGIFYYTKMTFGLKNGGGGGTSQKCVPIIQEAQIGRNVEAYIDDIVVKSKKQGDLLDDLKETFNNIRKYKMMFNPKKYTFWCTIRKTAWLYGIAPGNRYDPEEGGGH